MSCVIFAGTKMLPVELIVEDLVFHLLSWFFEFLSLIGLSF